MLKLSKFSQNSKENTYTRDLSKVIPMGSHCGVPIQYNKTPWFLTVKQQQIRTKQNEYLPHYMPSKQNPIKG